MHTAMRALKAARMIAVYSDGIPSSRFSEINRVTAWVSKQRRFKRAKLRDPSFSNQGSSRAVIPQRITHKVSYTCVCMMGTLCFTGFGW